MRSEFIEHAVRATAEMVLNIVGEVAGAEGELSEEGREIAVRVADEIIPLTEFLTENPRGTYQEYVEE